MAFFKFRKTTGDASAPKALVQSVETIRQRAKYRLVGAAVLILVGVIGLPLLFDKQPRPIAVDTPIEIPDKNKVLPLVIPSVPTGEVTASKAIVTASAAVVPAASTTAAASAPVEAPTAYKVETPAAAVVPPVVKPVASTPGAGPAEMNRAQALLEGKDVSAVASKQVAPVNASGQRFVVQVGAFADDARAREVRLKVERTGLKTYAQVADTKDGKRIRVRVGPFSSRAEAEKAAIRIKKLDLPAALLTL